MIKKCSRYILTFIFVFFISLTVTHAKELTLSELADEVLEVEPNATSIFVIGQHVFTSEHLLTTQDTMLAARTIKTTVNSAGQEIYDEMTISYFEGTYDSDWNVTGFEFYKNLVGKTTAKSSYDICYVDYKSICDNSGSGETNKYTVTWKNADGTVLETDTNVEAGSVPSYDGETPIKAADNTYTYEFIGWTPEITADSIINGDVVYVAKYKETYIEYTIIFENEDGTELSNTKYHYGDTVTVPTEPTKAATAEYTYKFVGWDKEVVTVAKDETYKATYDATKNKYTITFVNYDGETLYTEEVEYGSMPTYVGETPTREKDNENTYTFIGWSPELTNVTKAETYTAEYTTETNVYTVTWKNYDGSVLKTDTVEYGKVPEYTGTTPEKAADNTYTYTFDRWDKELVAVTGNVEYTATFKEAYIEYTIIFENEDGTELSNTKYHYGDTVTVPTEPTKAATEEYTYKFAGWDKEVVTVAKDETYKATYEATKNKYTVTWKNYDGTVLETDTLEYGTIPTYDGSAPTKTSDEQYDYYFAGWDKDIKAVTQDAVYEAEFGRNTRKYTITFVNYDGETLYTEEVEYGSMPTYVGETPTREKDNENTYTFIGWSPELTNVTKAETYTAEYTTETNVYTVTWKNYDGSVLKTDTVEYGKVPEYTGTTPEKAADNTYTYTFDKWDKELVAVTGNVEYTATFKEAYIEYTIIFIDEDGTELSNTKYHYGDTVTVPTEPTKAATEEYTYKFAGWDKEVVAVAKDETYKATYEVTKLVNVDGLVDKAFETINGYGATDKFEATLNENTVTVTIIDPTMSSMEALIGTGIAPAASNFLKEEGIKSVTLTSGDAELVVTKDSLDATDVYNFLISITKDSATAADLDGKVIDIKIAFEEGYATANSDSFEVVLDVKIPAEITTTVGDTTVGEVHEFEVTTKANDYAGVMVVGTSSFSNPEAIEKLEYYDPSTAAWYELTTDFGPVSGFPLSDATSKFRVTWKTAGEYTFTMKIVDVTDKTKVYAEVEKTVTVSERVAVVSNEDELLEALANPEYAKIELGDNITITSSVVISRSVEIDGKGYSIAKEGTPTYVSGGNNYIFKVYGISTADVKIKNIKLTNAMAAIMVGDYANVSLDSVDLDGNVWGGIEVKDTSTTSLTVNVENLAYTEEAYGKPIAWVDTPEVSNATISFVLENSSWSITTASVKNQVHYYLNAENAVE